MSEKTPVIVIDGGMVNAYLLQCGERFVLVDTLTRGKRTSLDKQLEAAGCSAGKLALIVCTHGDTDHTGSAAYLGRTFGAPIGMHRAEAEATETGDMSASRPHVGGFSKAVFSALIVFFRAPQSDRFTPDVLLEDGDRLDSYGLHAQALYLPGHSEGSIGILTDEGDLICGDLMTNRGRPRANTLVDDPAKLAASIERARQAGTKTVYPGHGAPFALSLLD